MPAEPPILIIGATGTVGRPLVRTLGARGRPLRVMARDVPRAAAAVPPEAGVEVVAGDLRDEASVRRALAGCRAVVTAVGHPMRTRPPDFDPDRDGTRVLLRAAVALGSGPLVIRTSGLGVPEAAAAGHPWWPIAAKLETDQAVADSGLPFVVLRPTWFVESIAAGAIGPTLVRLPGPKDRRLSWIAGEDYGRLVDAILERPREATGRMLDVHGAEELTIAEATAAFARPWRGYLAVLPLPRIALDAAALAVEPAAYVRSLLDFSFAHAAGVPRDPVADGLHGPGIGVESCSRALFERGELPSKRIG